MKEFTELEKMQSESRTRNRSFEEIPFSGEKYFVEEFPQKTHTSEEVKDVVRNFVKTMDEDKIKKCLSRLDEIEKEEDKHKMIWQWIRQKHIVFSEYYWIIKCL